MGRGSTEQMSTMGQVRGHVASMAPPPSQEFFRTALLHTCVLSLVTVDLWGQLRSVEAVLDG